MRRITAFLLTVALVGVCAVLPSRCEGGFKTALAAALPEEETISDETSLTEEVASEEGTSDEDETLSEAELISDDETLPEEDTSADESLPEDEQLPENETLPEDEQLPEEELLPEEETLSEEELLTEELVNEPLLLTSIPPVPSFTFSLPDAIELNDNATFELQVDVENFGENDRVNVSVTSLNGFKLVGENGSLPYSLSDFPSSFTEDATQQITVSFEVPDDLPPGTMTDTLTFTMELNTAE